MRTSSPLLPILLLSAGVVPAQTTWLVPEQIPTIQEAIDIAASGDTVLVSPGVYEENLMIAQKSLRVVSRRGPRATIVDAMGQGRPLRASNLFEGDDTLVQGFTLRGGKAPLGGGAFVSEDFIEIRDCIIRDNEATETGGGIYSSFNRPRVVNTIVMNNVAAESGGGIFCCGLSLPELVNCTVVNNHVTNPLSPGAGVHVYNPQTLLQSCIIRGNTSGNNIRPVNTLAGFEAIHCNFEGSAGYAGYGNIDADSLFVNGDQGDLHLRPGSPNVDAGADPPFLVDADYEGDPRTNGTIDIGADELHARMYIIGDRTPGGLVQVIAVDYPAGTQLSAWLSNGLQDPPLSTPFGNWWLENRRVELFSNETVPAVGVLRIPYRIPGGLPSPLPLYAQAFDGGGLSALETLLVE